MLEIICIIWLWKTNGKNALAKGQNPRKYHILTLAWWFGLEVVGVMFGMLVLGALSPGSDPVMYAYMCGILGAAIGGVISYRLAKNAPQGDYSGGNNRAYYQGMNQQNPYTPYPNANPQQNPELLVRPATVRIFAEPSFREGTGDDFFLNGRWVCRLNNGCEYTLLTSEKRNIVTIGSPGEMADNNVKFIAAEGGFVEIHTQDGRMLPERFKNYTSNPV